MGGRGRCGGLGGGRGTEGVGVYVGRGGIYIGGVGVYRGGEGGSITVEEEEK